MSEKASQGSAGRAIIGAFIITIFVKTFVFDLKIAEGSSMSPVIKPGKILVVCKASYGIKLPLASNYILMWKTPIQGDVLVFTTPLGEIAVKRCAEILADEFIALGDNSTQSYDSRHYGPVPIDNVIGRVLGIK